MLQKNTKNISLKRKRKYEYMMKGWFRGNRKLYVNEVTKWHTFR